VAGNPAIANLGAVSAGIIFEVKEVGKRGIPIGAKDVTRT
jgi:hypothetical protein